MDNKETHATALCGHKFVDALIDAGLIKRESNWWVIVGRAGEPIRVLQSAIPLNDELGSTEIIDALGELRG